MLRHEDLSIPSEEGGEQLEELEKEEMEKEVIKKVELEKEELRK